MRSLVVAFGRWPKAAATDGADQHGSTFFALSVVICDIRGRFVLSNGQGPTTNDAPDLITRCPNSLDIPLPEYFHKAYGSGTIGRLGSSPKV
jgi:hypothetical protein